MMQEINEYINQVISGNSDNKCTSHFHDVSGGRRCSCSGAAGGAAPEQDETSANIDRRFPYQRPNCSRDFPMTTSKL
jgi:hypothetical protein